MVKTAAIGSMGSYRFVVSLSRYQGQWLFSRHRARSTWEGQGGHIEDGETPAQAMERELFEESGALKAKIIPICDYAVSGEDGSFGPAGQFFFSEIDLLGELPETEIGEVRLFDGLPEDMTYPHILPSLWDKLQKFLSEQKEQKEQQERR